LRNKFSEDQKASASEISGRVNIQADNAEDRSEDLDKRSVDITPVPSVWLRLLSELCTTRGVKNADDKFSSTNKRKRAGKASVSQRKKRKGTAAFK